MRRRDLGERTPKGWGLWGAAELALQRRQEGLPAAAQRGLGAALLLLQGCPLGWGWFLISLCP